ncbi:protein adenylyltransferase SelO [Rhodopirellula halodulae]|uniref:protein adenylyltransferase SelO n=1 Tax=Rhodopirellula halodulae TaxID=2894198 RepID=UPI001E63D2AD|nr:YdiU family protein [Rhodopirellula sp. JC737]MCC9654736.1 YdiU family protein [Rhodopirellula sp. JC737]
MTFDLKFDNRFTRDLPADSESRNFVRQVHQAGYSRVDPTHVSNPSWVAGSKEVANLIGLDQKWLGSDELTQAMAGNVLVDGMEPFAMCYGGHQFGNWAGQLGDGRAINLGEVQTADNHHWTLQLKGAGRTPYSRTADGLAVLRSSVREFLCSEAMHHLGVPTTRALSLVLTGEKVLRDMFYDGHPEHELGAIVCRVAPSFIRFGNFEIFASREDLETLRTLVDHTIRSEFPHLVEGESKITPDTIAAMFEEVCRTTATMVVHWMRVGFVHGVMNTDNMSILGLTIDYGPYGWLEDYDPDWTPNTTDAQGRRYRYAHQPQIAQWNLVALANALVPLVKEAEPLQRGIATYVSAFQDEWHAMMAAKLGWSTYESETDDELVDSLLTLLQLAETDMTIFYRQLADIELGTRSQPKELVLKDVLAILSPALYVADEVTEEYRQALMDWMRAYQQRVLSDAGHEPNDAERRQRMNLVNPKYVLRNYLAQLAIDASEKGDHSVVHELLDVLRRPYDEQPGKERFAEKRPEWARHRPGCSMLSCSS